MLFQKNNNKKEGVQISESRARVLEIRKRKRRLKRLRAGFVVLLLGIIFTSIIIFLRNPLFLISDVSVLGTQVITSDEIKSVADEELSGYYLWLIPKRNGFLFSQKSLENKIHEEFPRIEKVVIERDGYKKVNIEVSERSSVYLWCDGAPSGPIVYTENCYYVDDTGYIFSEAPFFSGTIYFRFFGPRENLKEYGSIIGTQVFMPEKMAEVVRFKESLEESGLEPIGLSLYEEKQEASFFIFDGSKSLPPRIIFNPNSNLEDLAGNTKIAITSEPLASRLINDKDKLLYLDLRYEGKVYYKFSDEEEDKSE